MRSNQRINLATTSATNYSVSIGQSSLRKILVLVLCTFVASHASAETNVEELNVDRLQTKIYSAINKALPAMVAVRDRGSVFSAVIVSKEGHVLSAGHAVRPNRRYRVVMPSGKEYSAVGLGSNTVIDCAMLKITDKGDWPVAEMGHSSVLVKNQPVLGISYPGLLDTERGPSVRFGRIIKPVTTNEGMILSTVRIEPGDSGGALIDLDGKVIGIHSNIRRASAENYAVPVDTYRKLWSDLTTADWFTVDGYPSLPKLGFRGATSEETSGVEVLKIVEGGLAEKSGLKPGDVIVEVEGRDVDSPRRVRNKLIEIRSAGITSFEMTLLRDKKRKKVSFNVDTKQPIPVSHNELVNFVKQFSDLESKLDNLVCVIHSKINGKSNKIRATRLVRTGDGNLVSKSSEVGENPSVELADGSRVSARIVRRDRDNDLVLLQASLPGRTGIDFSRVYENRPIQRGQILLSPDSKGLGDVSVWSSNYFDVARSRASGGFLGVQHGMRDKNVVFVHVFSDGAAYAAGIKRGDILLKMDDTLIKKPDDLLSFLKNKDPNSSVAVTVKRGDKELKKEVTLGRRPEFSGHVADNLVGGKSIRRDGFSRVVSHDGDIRPEECGGPVFDLDGNFVGVNISRYSRTRCYVLPKMELKQFLDSVN